MINWDDAPKWANVVVMPQSDLGFQYYLDHNREGEPKLVEFVGLKQPSSHHLTDGDEGWHEAEVIARRPEEVKHDEVNNPAHYDLFPNEQVIDVIRKALTPEEFAGYCKGNVLKYRLRAGDKGDAGKCIAKANWYKNELWSK